MDGRRGTHQTTNEKRDVSSYKRLAMQRDASIEMETNKKRMASDTSRCNSRVCRGSMG